MFYTTLRVVILKEYNLNTQNTAHLVVTGGDSANLLHKITLTFPSYFVKVALPSDYIYLDIREAGRLITMVVGPTMYAHRMPHVMHVQGILFPEI